MEQENNRPIDDTSQVKNQENDILFYIGYIFLGVLFWQSWLRYDSGSQPITGSEWGSYTLATLLIFSNYFFPRKKLITASVCVFLISLGFSLSSTTESIDKVFAKNHKPLLVEQLEKPTLQNCPSALTDWNMWHECMLKYPQAEKERLEHNKKVGEFNATLPSKNAEIEKYNAELTFAKLNLQSQITILLYILLAIGIPSLEMYSVYILHSNTSESEEGSNQSKWISTLQKVFKPDLTEAMRQLVVIRKWDAKQATDKLQSIGFTNVEIAKVLDLHKSTISRKQKESRRQPVLFVLPTNRNQKQPDLFGNAKEA